MLMTKTGVTTVRLLSQQNDQNRMIIAVGHQGGGRMTNTDICYECTGYGDDWYTDPETGENVCACDECPYNVNDEDDDE